MTDKDPVLNELRVDKDIPDQDGAIGKLRIIYDGISTNTWLRPFGLTLKREHNLNLERPKTVELNDNFKNSIRERAQSANCILGRRHFELDKQELSRDQVLIGRSLIKKSGNHVTFSDDPEKGQQRVGLSCRSALTTASRSSVSPRGEIKRPFTGIGNFRDVRPHTAQCTIRNGKADLPDLSITQIVSCKGDARICEIRNKQFLVGVNDVRKSATILDDETISFRSINAMKEAYKTRIRSAPVLKYATDIHEEQDVSNNAHKEDERTCVSAYSNSNSLKSRTISANSSEDKDKCHTWRGSMLKPLLYSEDCDVAHGNGCPYKCKGCFRACLASDEYFENARSKSNLFSPRKKQGALPSNRKKVSYRLRPALRMAFLEQLSIEERAKHCEQMTDTGNSEKDVQGKEGQSG